MNHYPVDWKKWNRPKWIGRVQCILGFHEWKRYDKLVEQFFTGGYYAWHRCQRCKETKFKKCGRWDDNLEPGVEWGT